MNSSHIFLAGIAAFVPTSPDSVDQLVPRFGFSVVRLLVSTKKAGLWKCRTCPGLRRDASPFAALLSVRSSACILKPKSDIRAAEFCMLHVQLRGTRSLLTTGRSQLASWFLQRSGVSPASGVCTLSSSESQGRLPSSYHRVRRSWRAWAVAVAPLRPRRLSC